MHLAGTSYAGQEKIAVLITGWGIPVGYNFDYAWTTSDTTEYEGQECTIG